MTILQALKQDETLRISAGYGRWMYFDSLTEEWVVMVTGGKGVGKEIERSKFENVAIQALLA